MIAGDLESVGLESVTLAAAARRLAEAGCSANLIAVVTGHKSLREVARYTAAADQLRMARHGIDAIGRTTDR